MPCGKTKLASSSTAPRDRTPSRSGSRLHWLFLTVCLPREGRAPSRPINQLALITRRKMGRYGRVRRLVLRSPWRRRNPWRRRRPSLPENDIDLGGLQSLAAAEPNKDPTLGASLVGKTKLSSSSTAPSERTPSRSNKDPNTLNGCKIGWP